MTNEEIFNKICVLRDMQKRYFKTRNSEVLKKCKELEKEFDTIVNVDNLKQFENQDLYTPIALAVSMRKWQKSYFNSFSDDEKKAAKAYEKRVDIAITSIKQLNEPQQLKLFE